MVFHAFSRVCLGVVCFFAFLFVLFSMISFCFFFPMGFGWFRYASCVVCPRISIFSWVCFAFDCRILALPKSNLRGCFR